MDYRYGSHTESDIEYHFVWVTKYRYKVLTGDVALRVRELVRQTCAIFEIKILTGSSGRIMCTSWSLLRLTWLRARSCAGSKDGVRASCSRSSHC